LNGKKKLGRPDLTGAAQLQEKFRRLIKTKSCETSWPRSRNCLWTRVNCPSAAIIAEREEAGKSNHLGGRQFVGKSCVCWQQGRAISDLLEFSWSEFVPMANDPAERTGLLQRRSKRLAPPINLAGGQTRIETCRHPGCTKFSPERLNPTMR
jgi:hypothetical protein